jgi:hypothetical protein
VGVDEGVEGLVAFAVALGLPGADGAAALEAGDDALGGQLAEVVGVEAAGEVDRAGAGLGQAQAGVDGVLHRVHADDEERDLALVGARRAARPDRDAGPAAALDRPDAAGEAGAAELVGHLGVVAAGVDGGGAHRQVEPGGMREGRLQHHVEIGPEARPGRIAPEHAVVDHPRLLVAAPAEDLHLDPVALHVDARGQHGDGGGQRLAPVLAPGHQRIGRDGVARLVLPGLAQLGVDPDLQAGRVLADAAVLGGDLGPCLPRGIERGEVEARGAAVALGGRAPFARGQQAGLLVLVVDAAAGLADQMRLRRAAPRASGCAPR